MTFHFRFMEGSDEGVRCDSTKMMKVGFEYTYDTKKILDDSVACARRLGSLIKWPFRVLWHCCKNYEICYLCLGSKLDIF